MITVEELLKISKKGIDVELFLQTKLVTDEVDIENYYLLLGSYKIQTRNKNRTNESFESTNVIDEEYKFVEKELVDILERIRKEDIRFPNFM